jgi:hypothetical protein
LLVAIHGYGTLSVTLSEENWLLGVQEQGGEENITTNGSGSDRRQEKITYLRASQFVLFTKYYLGGKIKEGETSAGGWISEEKS